MDIVPNKALSLSLSLPLSLVFIFMLPEVVRGSKMRVAGPERVCVALTCGQEAVGRVARPVLFPLGFRDWD